MNLPLIWPRYAETSYIEMHLAVDIRLNQPAVREFGFHKVTLSCGAKQFFESRLL